VVGDDVVQLPIHARGDAAPGDVMLDRAVVAGRLVHGVAAPQEHAGRPGPARRHCGLARVRGKLLGVGPGSAAADGYHRAAVGCPGHEHLPGVVDGDAVTTAAGAAQSASPQQRCEDRMFGNAGRSLATASDVCYSINSGRGRDDDQIYSSNT
jgi:hypothetical protein